MHTIYQNAVIIIASVDCEGPSPGMQTRSALERSRRRPFGSLDTRGWGVPRADALAKSLELCKRGGFIGIA